MSRTPGSTRATLGLPWSSMSGARPCFEQKKKDPNDYISSAVFSFWAGTVRNHAGVVMFTIIKSSLSAQIRYVAGLNFFKYRELRGAVKTVSIRKNEQEDSEAQAEIHEPVKAPSRKPEECFPPLALVDPNDPPDIVPNFAPTFNFAAYINKSESLQQFLKLGVDLSKIEKRKGLPQFVLKLDFEKDVKPYIIFLTDKGVPAESLGEFITKNPLIFKEDIDNLQVRINYLEVKNFKPADIKSIITRNPFWLMFSTQRIDRRLGFFQKNFKLSGNDVRFLAAKQPRLITYNMEHVRKSTFCIKEEMGFDEDEVKCLLLSKPRLWMLNQDELIERFGYIHKVMSISHERIIQTPEILTSREFRLKQRHEFLKLLGKAQYDPSKDLYISLKSLVEGSDKDFVINVAKADMKTYDRFLRTL